MKVSIIGSGSKGNCTHISSGNTNILIDAGLSKLQLRTNFNNTDTLFSDIKAIFVTHEHTDHIKYLDQLLSVTGATLYITEVTYRDAEKKLRTSLDRHKHVFIEPMTRYDIDDLSIVPIELSHDTTRCMGYMVKELNTDLNNTYAQLTDTGYVDDKYIEYLAFMNTVMIESNHDLEMLMNSSRPYFLKERIKSNHGHLSNDQCIEVIDKFCNEYTKRIILGHLSEECNTESIAYDNVVRFYDNNVPFELLCARQYETISFTIGEDDD